MNKIIVFGLLMIPFGLFLNNSPRNVEKQNIKIFTPVQNSKLPGEKIFKKYCVSCHQVDGGGVPRLNPPLIGTSYVLGDKKPLIEILLNGMKNITIEDKTYTNPMPSFKTLKDQEIADVLTYVRKSFGNDASAITSADVKSVRAKMK